MKFKWEVIYNNASGLMCIEIFDSKVNAWKFLEKTNKKYQSVAQMYCINHEQDEESLEKLRKSNEQWVD